MATQTLPERPPVTATIPAALDVRLSGLRCDGENLGGLLLAGFIDDAMQKQNGKVMPLAAWPGNKLHLSGAQIVIDDHIRIKGGFGPTGAGAAAAGEPLANSTSRAAPMPSATDAATRNLVRPVTCLTA